MNPLPEALRSLLRSAGVDEGQVLDSRAEPADGGDYLMDPQLTVELLADALRALHSVDPTRASDAAMGKLSMGAVVLEARAAADCRDAPELDEAYSHMDRGRLLEVLEEGARQLAEFPPALLVVTHGSPAPATLRCEGARAVGFVDWDHAALADPHRDLAYAATAVASHLGPMLVPVLMERYGVRPDPRRLDWWALAQQLTGTATTVRSPDP